MKISKKRKNNPLKALLLVVLALLLLGGGYLAYAKTQSHWPFTKTAHRTTQTPAASPDKDTSPDSNKSSTNGGVETPKTPKPYETPASSQNPNSGSSLKGRITSVNQTDTALEVRTLIEKVTSSGECNLELSRDASTPIIQSVGIQPLASSSTCKGFSVPMSQLTPGTWQLKITVATDGKNATFTKDVQVN